MVFSPDLKVERIRVGHDTHGSGKGIFLDEIEVIPDDEEPLFFPCSCWLAEDIGDGKMEREIYPGTRTPGTSGKYLKFAYCSVPDDRWICKPDKFDSLT